MKDRPSSSQKLMDIHLENSVSLITSEINETPARNRKKNSKNKSFKIKPMVHFTLCKSQTYFDKKRPRRRNVTSHKRVSSF